jgi:DNA gyrase subunit A
MEYDNIRKGGLAAVTLRENDELIDVRLTDGEKDIILVTRKGMSIRFQESDVRPLGRVSQGVRGISLDEDDYVVGMGTAMTDATLLVVTENGFGKRTELDEYKTQTRAGKGILTYRVTEKTGPVAGIRLVNETDEIMLISSDGTIIRLEVSGISILGRATQGVTLMRTSEGNRVVSIARIETDGEDDNQEGQDAEQLSGEDQDSENGQDDGQDPQ